MDNEVNLLILLARTLSSNSSIVSIQATNTAELLN